MENSRSSPRSTASVCGPVRSGADRQNESRSPSAARFPGCAPAALDTATVRPDARFAGRIQNSTSATSVRKGPETVGREWPDPLYR